MTIATPKHYLVVSSVAWGHNRTNLVLALRLLLLHPDVVLTYLSPQFHKPLVHNEVARFKLSPSDHERFKIIHVPLTVNPPEPRLGTTNSAKMFEELCSFNMKIMEPVLRAIAEGTHNEAQEHPVSVILSDLMILYGDDEDKIKDLFPSSRMYRLWSPSSHYLSSMDPRQNSPLTPVVDQYFAAIKQGVPPEEAYSKYYIQDVLYDKETGVGPMYLWEADTQNVSHELYLPVSAKLSLNLHKYPSIITWPAFLVPSFHPDDFIVGAQLAPDVLHGITDIAVAPPEDPEDEYDEDLATPFLKAALQEQGPHSVALVAFGSLHFPCTPPQFMILVNSLIDKGLRVLLLSSIHPKKITQSQEYKDFVARVGNKFVWLDWADQAKILANAAISFFVTHSGPGSVLEAMAQAVPTILWPGGFDQPYVASQIQELGTGVQLFQVRKRHIGRTIALGVELVGTDAAVKEELDQVIDKMNGLRDKCKMLQGQLREDVEVGKSYQNMLRLGDL